MEVYEDKNVVNQRELGLHGRIFDIDEHGFKIESATPIYDQGIEVLADFSLFQAMEIGPQVVTKVGSIYNEKHWITQFKFKELSPEEAQKIRKNRSS